MLTELSLGSLEVRDSKSKGRRDVDHFDHPSLFVVAEVVISKLASPTHLN